MKRVVSVSLWGDEPRYIQGAITNAYLSEKYYPGWEYRIYAETHLHPQLCGIPAVVLSPIPSWTNGRFWRFAPAFEPDVEVMISRDCDSRIGERESRCVEEWLQSDKKYHVIRDHIRHYDFPMLAGMWGIRGNPAIHKDTILFWSKDKDAYLVDQLWLANHIWVEASQNVYVSGYREIDWMRESFQQIYFVGQGYDQYDKAIYI